MAVRHTRRRALLSALFLCAIFSASLPLFVPPRVRAASSTIVISQIYGGGGNSGATYKNDFIELFNRGNTTVNISGWSVQYASSTGGTWQQTNINGALAPGQYFLVQQDGGSNGANLPTPDATGTIAMSATAGKVALVSNSSALSGPCPTGSDIVDFVGYDSSTNCSETAPATGPSDNVKAVVRAANGCTETDNNSTDFTRLTANPRNTATTLAPCSSATNTPTPTPTFTNTATSTSTPTATKTNTPTQTKTFTPTPTAVTVRAVVINEIAWGGTAASANDEWIELFNTTSSPISLNGWSLLISASVTVTLSGTLPANGYFLLERTDDTTISDLTADQIYTGGLNNSGETLTLKDPAGNIVDTANGDGGGWPAGSASSDYRSMERKNPLTADADSNWQSNDGVTRNGSDANGSPINGTPKQPNTATLALTATPTPTRTPTPTQTPTRTLTPTPTATTPAANLLIIEVCYDGMQTDEGDEFIEIFNPTGATVDLSQYKIGDEETLGSGEGMYNFPAGAQIAANGIVLIAKNAEQFRNRFGFYPNYELVTTGGLTDTGSVPNLSKYTAWASGALALANDGDEVLLLGPSDQIVDAVAWKNGNFAAVALSGDADASEPRSLQRYNTYDANQMTFDFLADTPAPSARHPAGISRSARARDHAGRNVRLLGRSAFTFDRVRRARAPAPGVRLRARGWFALFRSHRPRQLAHE